MHPAELELAIARGLDGFALAAFRAGRQAVRSLLIARTAPWAAAPILANPEGRPLLESRDPLHPAPWISISHASAVAIASLSHQPIGIDVEAVGRIQQDTWPILFTTAERARLRSLPSDIAPTLFYGFKECAFKLLRRRDVCPDFDLQHVEITCPEPRDRHASVFGIRVEGVPWRHARLSWTMLGDDTSRALAKACLPTSATDLVGAMVGPLPACSVPHVMTVISLPHMRFLPAFPVPP